MTGRLNPNGYDWVFSHNYAAGLLCFINDVGYAYVTDLLVICSSHRTMTRIMDELLSYGLVQLTIEDKGHIAKRYCVTPKGRTAARLLNKVRVTVEGFPHSSGTNACIENF